MKSLSPYFNRQLLPCLILATLFAGCGNLATRNDNGAGRAAADKLPYNYKQGLSHMASGDFAGAIPILEQFSTENPDLAGPWLNLGIALRQNGRGEDALKALGRALELNPENPAAWQQQGITQRELGMFEAARQSYMQALKLNPGYALAHRNLGILYDLYLQEPDLALQQYRLYLEFSDEPDENVNHWIVDLERRSSQQQAKISR